VTVWAAHLVFHLASNVGTVVPVLQRLAQDLGSGALGTPDWRMAQRRAPEGALLGLDILLLDVGLLLALHASWRVARRVAPGRRRAIAVFLPFGLLAAGGWILGLWIVVQPMEMRGMMLLRSAETAASPSPSRPSVGSPSPV